MNTTVIAQIAALKRMTVAELQERWRALYGEAPRSRNRDYMWRRLAWRIQELQHGGLSARTRARIDELTPDTLTRPTTSQRGVHAAVAATDNKRSTRTKRDARLPTAGTVIVKQYKGRELRLLVLDEGFELDGQAFRSLSEAARHVTGSRWNGRLFWGLTQRRRKA